MQAGDFVNGAMRSGLVLQVLCGISLVCGGLLGACRNSAPTSTQFPTYKLRGTIVAVHVEDKSASIDAEAIPGFMDAMTMEYTIHDAAAFSKLKPKDKITADLIIGPDGAYVDHIKIEK